MSSVILKNTINKKDGSCLLSAKVDISKDYMIMRPIISLKMYEVDGTNIPTKATSAVSYEGKFNGNGQKQVVVEIKFSQNRTPVKFQCNINFNQEETQVMKIPESVTDNWTKVHYFDTDEFMRFGGRMPAHHFLQGPLGPAPAPSIPRLAQGNTAQNQQLIMPQQQNIRMKPGRSRGQRKG